MWTRAVWMAVVVALGAVAGASVARRAGMRADDGLPRRVWWRVIGVDEFDPPYVADHPGGPALAGRWQAYARCPYCQASPDKLMLFADAAGRQAGETPLTTYEVRMIDVVTNGQRWTLLTRPMPDGSESFTDEERRLVGRWRHSVGTRTITLDLLEGGEGRGDDGTEWKWMAGGESMELQHQTKQGGWIVDSVELDADGRAYRGRADRDLPIIGERLDR